MLTRTKTTATTTITPATAAVAVEAAKAKATAAMKQQEKKKHRAAKLFYARWSICEGLNGANGVPPYVVHSRAIILQKWITFCSAWKDICLCGCVDVCIVRRLWIFSSCSIVSVALVIFLSFGVIHSHELPLSLFLSLFLFLYVSLKIEHISFVISLILQTKNLHCLHTVNSNLNNKIHFRAQFSVFFCKNYLTE